MGKVQRLAVFAVLIALAAVVAWQHNQRTPDQGMRPDGSLDIESIEVVESNSHPSDTAIRREVERKALEYATMLILPGLDRPDLAKIPAGEVAVKKTGKIGNVEQWASAGVVEHQGVRLPWQITIAFHDGRFSAIRVVLDGKVLAEPDSTPARAIREAEPGP